MPSRGESNVAAAGQHGCDETTTTTTARMMRSSDERAWADQTTSNEDTYAPTTGQRQTKYGRAPAASPTVAGTHGSDARVVPRARCEPIAAERDAIAGWWLHRVTTELSLDVDRRSASVRSRGAWSAFVCASTASTSLHREERKNCASRELDIVPRTTCFEASNVT